MTSTLRASLLLLVLPLAACGQTSSSVAPATATASPQVELEVRAMLAQAAVAYSRGDYEGVLRYYEPSEDVTMVIYAPGAPPGPDGKLLHFVTGIDSIRKFYLDAPMFKPGFNRPVMSFTDVRVQRLKPDLVNVVALIEMKGGDERVPRHAVTSMVLHKGTGQWRIVHDRTQ